MCYILCFSVVTKGHIRQKQMLVRITLMEKPSFAAKKLLRREEFMR